MGLENLEREYYISKILYEYRATTDMKGTWNCVFKDALRGYFIETELDEIKDIVSGGKAKTFGILLGIERAIQRDCPNILSKGESSRQILAFQVGKAVKRSLLNKQDILDRYRKGYFRHSVGDDSGR